jgi:hypothetical protein
VRADPISVGLESRSDHHNEDQRPYNQSPPQRLALRPSHFSLPPNSRQLGLRPSPNDAPELQRRNPPLPPRSRARMAKALSTGRLYSLRVQEPLSLLDLWQISPQAVQQSRHFQTRKNKDKAPAADALHANNVSMDTLHPQPRAFRLDVTMAFGPGASVVHGLPAAATQADQGPEANIICLKLVKKLGIPLINLA